MYLYHLFHPLRKTRQNQFFMKISFFPYTLIGRKKLSLLQKESQQLQKEVKSATAFVKRIENNELDASYDDSVNVQESELASALISMRDQLTRFAEQERQRNWVTQGLAKFADILRASTDDVQDLGDQIISNLVKYVGANQGGLFIIAEDENNDVCLDLLSCYAYNKKKYMEKRIYPGEGVVGQTYLEKEYIYMTEVPQKYVTITSGLGESTPSSVLVMPLKTNEEIFGVVELASFNQFKDYQIEFLQKLGENIASSIATVKISERTRRLLIEAQEQAEMLRAQEEEMRQNVEELQATQEEMRRKQIELENMKKKLENNEMVLKKALEKARETEKSMKEEMNAAKAMIDELRAQINAQ